MFVNVSSVLDRIFQNHGVLIIQAFLVVFGSAVIDFVQRRLLNRLANQLAKTRTPWDDAFLDSVRRPLSILIWVVGITFAAQIVARISPQYSIISDAVGPLRNVAIIGLCAWFLIRFIGHAANNVIATRREAGKEVDVVAVEAIAKLARISAMITAALVTMQTLGFDIAGVWAFGGIGGLVIGLAAKDLLSNFFGGLMLYLDRPFSPGDWVRSPDKEIEGTVEEIGWRLTRIRSFSKRPLYVPNSVFSTITVENPSRMTNRRINETIGIRYDDAAKMGEITAEVKRMLIEHPAIDETMTLMVNFNAFAASSLDFFIYCFTHTTVWTEYHEIKQDVLLRIKGIIADHGAEIAFPTSTIHLEGGQPGVSPEPEPEK
ncbi:mechanosensitive ion channel family protein [bacterium]|nr:mechanosensitive ion channel family protein [bacterium]